MRWGNGVQEGNKPIKMISILVYFSIKGVNLKPKKHKLHAEGVIYAS